MTVGTTHTQRDWPGDGATTVFPVNFEFEEPETLDVFLVANATGIAQMLAFGVDYSVDGGGGSTGTVTLLIAAPTTEQYIRIRRTNKQTQPDDFQRGDGLDVEQLEKRIDVAFQLIQELTTQAGRGVRVVDWSQADALDLNLIGGAGLNLVVSGDERGIVLAAGTMPPQVSLSPFGTNWVGLSGDAAGRSALELGTSAVVDIGTSGATVPLCNGINDWAEDQKFEKTAEFSGRAMFNGGIAYDAATVTIANDIVTGDGSYGLRIQNQSAAPADDVIQIATTNYIAGSAIAISAAVAGQVPTIKHSTAQGAPGNIYLAGDRDVALDDRDKFIELQLDLAGPKGEGWYETGRNFPLVQSGSTVLTQFASTNIEQSISTVMPVTAALPTSTQGEQVLALDFAPRFSDSTLLMTLSGNVAETTAGAVLISAALFREGAANAEKAALLNKGSLGTPGSLDGLATVLWRVPAVSTASVNWRVRMGPSAGTMVINRTQIQANAYGNGTLETVLRIDEIAA